MQPFNFLDNKKYSQSALATYYHDFVSAVTEENGKPNSSSDSESVWTLSDFTVSVAIDSFNDYNGSQNPTVGIIFSKAENTGAPKKTATKSGILRVSASANCRDYNHVGNSWSYEFAVNGDPISGTSSMTFTVRDVIKVSASVTENDKKPDYGYSTETHTITEADLSQGFTISLEVPVSENAGRYSGYVAIWNVTFRFWK